MDVHKSPCTPIQAYKRRHPHGAPLGRAFFSHLQPLPPAQLSANMGKFDGVYKLDKNYNVAEVTAFMEGLGMDPIPSSS